MNSRAEESSEESGDEIAVRHVPRVAKADLTGTSNARSAAAIEPRRSGRDKTVSNYSLKPRRGKKKTLSSKKGAPRSPAVAVQTERKRIRENIAASTKPRRDAFLVHHSSLFEPVLPVNNYITKLKLKLNAQDVKLHPGEALPQPKGIKATMKPYQLEGLAFLVKMYKNGMPAMLGDEMGLGKTLQTLALFQWLTENEPTGDGDPRPFLVVCPLSVLSSWENEIKRWCPALNHISFHGPKAKREQIKQDINGMRPDICVTTYESFVSEQNWFQRVFVWRYVVLDEGHKIKNEATHMSSALQSLSAEYRLLLTGTPLQNNLAEMWALLHWLLPDVFTDDTVISFRNAFDLNAGKASTSFMDDARRLLEVLMLRRMKASPGVNLDLPPKEEILLYVPLTAEQRKWYMTLITRIDQATFDQVFKDAVKKEEVVAKDDPDSMVDKSIVENQVNELPVSPAQTQAGTNQWKKLMMLVMQLRKVCSHPYLIPGAMPEPYTLNDNVRRSSGKFIVLDKMIDELVVKQRKKLIIFSGFTSTLDLCEDLLACKGANSLDSQLRPFKYTRLDGGTSLGMRNLSIRLFNDAASEFRVILISTRAGGLGINLVSASDIVFLDQDWNPQVTLQAEARAHRIGQTKKVTVYKLCAQGTVEEQMMNRIRKKLYLSVKITESMRNVHVAATHDKKRKFEEIEDDSDDGPQLGTSQLMTFLRRGAQTLAAPKVDAAELSTWSWEEVLQKCKDTTSQDADAGSETVDEEAWLNQVEKVECAVFEGRKHHRSSEKGAKITEVLDRQDRRVGKNTTVLVDGYAISKESMLCNDWEAVPTRAGKDPRLADPTKVKKAPIRHQEHCQVCWDGGELHCCNGCPRSYHIDCLEPSFQKRATTWTFYCPQHECHDCAKKTADAGGLMYRCRWCERGYCEDCVDWEQVKLEDSTLVEFEMLGHEPTNAWFVECHTCRADWQQNPSTELHVKRQKHSIELKWAVHQLDQRDMAFTLDFGDAKRQSGASVQTPRTVTEAATPEDELRLDRPIKMEESLVASKEAD